MATKVDELDGIQISVVGKDTMPDARNYYWKRTLLPMAETLQSGQVIRVVLRESQVPSGPISAWNKLRTKGRIPRARQKKQANGKYIVWLWFELPS